MAINGAHLVLQQHPQICDRVEGVAVLVAQRGTPRPKRLPEQGPRLVELAHDVQQPSQTVHGDQSIRVPIAERRTPRLERFAQHRRRLMRGAVNGNQWYSKDNPKVIQR